jgi:hypothetical protein
MSRDFTDRRPVCVEEVLHNDRLLPSYYTVTEIKNFVELGDFAQVISGQNFQKRFGSFNSQ